MQDPFEKRLQLTSRLCLGSYVALQILFFFKTIVLPMGGREPNITMWLVHSLPLLLVLPGMLKGNYRAYAWLSFAILLYFMLNVEGMFLPQPSPYHGIAVALIVVIFISCVLVIRWLGLQNEWRMEHSEEKSIL